MKLTTTLITAAFIAGSATAALAQAAGGGSAGGGGGASGGGAGSDVSTPRKNVQRPTPNSPPVNRRNDDMAPMQGSNVSSQPLGPDYQRRMDR
jgi:hypothetical protein